jgi:galactitol-specific phosphotransferase system IIB component
MNFQLSIPVPFVTIQQYSQLTGMAVGTIKDKIGKGDIIIKSKKLPREQPLVNMIAMHKIAMKEAEMKVA